MLTGRVLRFDEVRGYGFIVPDHGGEDVFLHANTLDEADKRAIVPGLPVEFESVDTDRGPKALVVRVLRSAGGAAGDVAGAELASAPPARRRGGDPGGQQQRRRRAVRCAHRARALG